MKGIGKYGVLFVLCILRAAGTSKLFPPQFLNMAFRQNLFGPLITTYGAFFLNSFSCFHHLCNFLFIQSLWVYNSTTIIMFQIHEFILHSLLDI